LWSRVVSIRACRQLRHLARRDDNELCPMMRLCSLRAAGKINLATDTLIRTEMLPGDLRRKKFREEVIVIRLQFVQIRLRMSLGVKVIDVEFVDPL
jgi:hypothetical protein